jgi:hypothetical protein
MTRPRGMSKEEHNAKVREYHRQYQRQSRARERERIVLARVRSQAECTAAQAVERSVDALRDNEANLRARSLVPSISSQLNAINYGRSRSGPEHHESTHQARDAAIPFGQARSFPSPSRLIAPSPITASPQGSSQLDLPTGSGLEILSNDNESRGDDDFGLSSEQKLLAHRMIDYMLHILPAEEFDSSRPATHSGRRKSKILRRELASIARNVL